MKKKFIAFYVVAFVFANAFFFASPICAYGNSLPALTGTITCFQDVDSSIKWSGFCVVVLLLVVDVLILENTKPGKALRTTLLYLYALFSFSLGAFFEAELLPGNENHDERPLPLIICVSLLIFLTFVVPPLRVIWEHYSQTKAFDVHQKVVDAADEFDELLEKARQERQTRS